MSLMMVSIYANANPSVYCFNEAAAKYGLNPMMLYAIAKVESGFNPYAIRYNRDKNGRIKSYDIGVMQINSSWFPTLRRYGIDYRYLYDPCTNIHIGAWILAQCVSKFGNNWKAIDCYNKGNNAKYSSKYVWNVYYAYMKGVAMTTKR